MTLQQIVVKCLCCGGAIVPGSEVRCHAVEVVSDHNDQHVLYVDADDTYIIGCGRHGCPSSGSLAYGIYRGIHSGRPEVDAYETDHYYLKLIVQHNSARRHPGT